MILAGFLPAFFLTRCANIVPPNGGPKDTIPPVLLSALPRDSSLHFHSGKIVLNFDEYIQTDNASRALIFTPSVQQQPVLITKFRTLTIELKDSLKANTTYTLNFGNSIRDLDEGNPIQDFRYIFSTGSYLDSLRVTGQVTYAETGLPDSNIVVMLYTDLSDSVVSRKRPVYYTLSDGKGDFQLENLPRGIFKLFALKDNNNTLVYQDSAEFIAFADTPLVMNGNITGEHLYLFAAAPKASPSGNTSQGLPGLPAPPPLPAKNAKKRPARHITVSPQFGFGNVDITSPISFILDQKARKFDSARVHLLEDTAYRPVPFSATLDSTGTQILVNRKWDPDMDYRLILDSMMVLDSTGAYNRQDTLNFHTRSESDYGTIILGFSGIDSSLRYIVEIVSGGTIEYSGPLRGTAWRMDMVRPGTYGVRLLADRNGNGKWDNGRYYGGKRQPEHVIAFPEQVHVRANWQNRTRLSL